MRVALVLGAKVQEDGAPSPALRRRAEHAAGLYLRGEVGRILASGGALWGGPSEAAVIARVCAEAGVPEAVLTLEQAARSTAENLMLSRPLLEALDAAEVVVVTDGFHAPRVRLLARRMGMAVRLSCPEAPPLPLRRRLLLRAREGAALALCLLRGTGR
ncbi:MAG: YdcF family protein [Sagittula sp.]|uniref:YdcF family protein n=1 Tax=Sagittula sp. TaxID=2038081 RepID=UPI004059EFC7